MTLKEVLKLNERISILPRPLAAEIRNLDIFTIRKILQDPRQQLVYLKIDLFLKAIRELQPPEPAENFPDIMQLLQNIKENKQQKPIDIKRIKQSARYKRAVKAYEKLPIIH